MRKLFTSSLLIIGVLLCSSFYIQRILDKPSVKNISHDRGEEIKYRLHYGWITAGHGTASVHPKLYKVNDKVCYKYEIEGYSTNAISWMVRVKDRWVSYVDTTTMYPTKAIRSIKESKYRMNETVDFDQTSTIIHRVYTSKSPEEKHRTYNGETNIHDIVSTFYYLRNIDYTHLKKGDRIKMSTFVEDTVYKFALVHSGKETIKTEMGKIRTIKLVPDMPNNDLFDGKESVRFWVSDDKNRLPLKVEVDMFVGSVEMEVEKVKNLKYELNKE